jgi:hypothetical protein
MSPRLRLPLVELADSAKPEVAAALRIVKDAECFQENVL